MPNGVYYVDQAYYFPLSRNGSLTRQLKEEINELLVGPFNKDNVRETS